MGSQSVQGILFDLDDTLFDFSMSEKEAFFKALDSESIGLGGFGVDRFFLEFKKINQELWSQFQKGIVQKEFLRVERFRKTLGLVGSKSDPEKLADTYVEFLSQSAHVIEGAREICEVLNSKKIKLAVVTNGISRVQHRRIQGAGFEKYFSAVIVSEDVGKPKPHPEIFFAALNKLGLSPQNVLIVGDRLDADILGAKNIGSKSVLVQHSSSSEIPAGGTDFNVEPDYKITKLLELKKIIESLATNKS